MIIFKQQLALKMIALCRTSFCSPKKRLCAVRTLKFNIDVFANKQMSFSFSLKLRGIRGSCSLFVCYILNVRRIISLKVDKRFKLIIATAIAKQCNTTTATSFTDALSPHRERPKSKMCLIFLHSRDTMS